MRDRLITTSIVMITYNKASRLLLTLESVKRLEQTENSELIIVNDGSTDQSNLILKEFQAEYQAMPLTVIETENRGRAAARNTGIHHSKGDIIIFVDDDLLLDPLFLSGHVKAHKNNKMLAVHGQIFDLPYLKLFSDPASGTYLKKVTPHAPYKSLVIKKEMLMDGSINPYLQRYAKKSRFEQDIEQLLHATDSPETGWVCFTGGNVSVRKNNLLRVGLFDETFGRQWGCEDLELGYRLAHAGISFLYSYIGTNYHMSHFRKDIQEKHDRTLEIFCKKHNDVCLDLLKKYFYGGFPSLIAWDQAVQNLAADKAVAERANN